MDGEELRAIAQVAHDQITVGSARTALQLYEGLCALQPEEVEHWMGRALSHEALGEEDAAEAALRQGLELAPRDARFHLKLAEHLLARADHFEAKSRLETSIGLGLSSAALRARAEAMLVILALRTRAIEAKRRGGR